MARTVGHELMHSHDSTGGRISQGWSETLGWSEEHQFIHGAGQALLFHY